MGSRVGIELFREGGPAEALGVNSFCEGAPEGGVARSGKTC